MTNLTNSEVVAYLGLPQSILTEIGTAQGEEYKLKSNEFITALMNKLVYQKIEKFDFSNPFAKFDSFPVNYGDTIENVFIEKPLGYKYGTKGTDPFAGNTPSVKTLYATINYQMQYNIKIKDVEMRKAVLNEYGLTQLVSGIVNQLGNAMSIDEYSATIRMLNNPEIFANSTGAKGSKAFEELDVSSEASISDKYKAITQKIVDVSTDFAYPAPDNNALGVLTATPRERELLIIKQSVLNHINLDYLTGVFNLSKVDLLSRIMGVRSFKTIQTDDNGENPTEVGDDIDFMILDTRGFDNHVALRDSGMIYNPRELATIHYSNLWKILSFKYYYNAKAYKVKFDA